MNLSQRNAIWNAEDDINWDVIEISKVNNKIIKKLIKNIKQEISETFFISFESLIKISWKKNIKPSLESSMKSIKKNDWHLVLFKLLLKYVNVRR